MQPIRSQLLSLLTKHDGCTIPQIADTLGLSVGTATKNVSLLLQEGLLEDIGTVESTSGRRPHLYRLKAEAGCFLGVEVSDRYISAGLMDFRGEMLQRRIEEDYDLTSPDAFTELCRLLVKAAAQTTGQGYPLKNICISLPGRIDNLSGKSYSNFFHPGKTLVDELRESVDFPLCLYNDTRAMTYGEFLKGAGAGSRNMLFINVNWGLGMGIVIDAHVYGGKSGFAGEFGHVYGYDNQIICRCGKRGCNETEISGQALQRILTKRIYDGESSILSPRVLASDKALSFDEIMDAIAREDVLCIEVLEEIGLRLGEKTAGLINLFNPELVVVGGELAMTGDYLLDPMRMAVNKHAIHLVSQDTRICRSRLGREAGLVGACLVARSRFLGEVFEY